MKIMNVVFGVGIAVIVFIVALLGIQAFYPEPKYEKFCNISMYSTPVISTYTIYDCPDNMTVVDCRKLIYEKDINSSETKAREKEQQDCSTKYDEANKNYGKIFFLIASILGLIALIVSFFLLNTINISAGVASAGIVLLIVAFVRGWNSTNDIFKFVAGLIIGAVIIFLTLKINKRFSGEKEDTNNSSPNKKNKRK
jgi:hypothetical protein